ncbi:MAG: phosphoribosylformylglycinamidine synthase subunit PurL [Chloroflexota bacterium]
MATDDRKGNTAAPWAEVGLSEDEYRDIIARLGREPNALELGLFGVMWSEHCSYKSSRRHLKRLPTTGKRILQGPGENAGIVDVGDGVGIAFKIESHNHPSAVEPYQGAATGVGGILRDIFTMGARPIACLDSLRFGDPTDPRVRYLFGGVVGGIAGYGNCFGVPTVGGEVYFDDSYRGNPLVNAMAVGRLDAGRIFRGIAAGEGNPIMVVGSRTGRDGIHGASLLASRELSAENEGQRPAVQVGDPFMEKLLLEACLELMNGDAVVGIQDMGAAGVISSSCEMASRGNAGLDMEITLVPRREEGMTPYEVMLSESQERMLVCVKQGRESEVQEIFRKWDLEATVIGHVTTDGLLRVRENGAVVAEIPARALAHDAPEYDRPQRRPDYLDDAQRFDPATVGEPSDYTAVLKQLLASPNIASKEAVYRQYDHMVQTNTSVLPGSDAAVLRLKGTKRGIALSTDCNARYCYLDPRLGGALAVAEAARNVACSGAEPVAITNCLNFGNPEKPEVMWQFTQVLEGMAEACRALDTPVTGGNVSFYNDTDGESIMPTPVIGMLGVLDDVSAATAQGFRAAGDAVLALGQLGGEIGASEYLARVHGRVAGRPAALSLDQERAVQRVCIDGIRAGLIVSAHDCSEGGLAVAISEAAITAEAGARGIDVTLAGGAGLRADALLFGEAPSRIIVSCRPAAVGALSDLAAQHGVSCTRLGTVGGDRLTVTVGNQRLIDAPVAELATIWREAIPCLLKG